MGIPLYFKQLSEKYPTIIKNNIDNRDNLFLDLNCAIHPCCKHILENYNKTHKDSSNLLEKKMITEVLEYIKKLVLMVNPKLLYIAIDGVAPCAKMNQQRLRRYKAILEKKLISNIKKDEGKENWNTNAISPGTEFMNELSKKIVNEINNNFIYKDIKVYFSDSKIPGEGEHKILEFIKKTELNNNIIIYGLDADLIVLSFVSHKSNIFLLREALQFGKPLYDKFLYLSIDELKYYIVKDLQEKILVNDPTILFNIDKLNSLLDDYIFITFLVGNDFIPHLLSFNLRQDGLTFLMEKYAELYVIHEENLIVKNNINNGFFKTYLNELERYENGLLIKMDKKRKRFRLNRTYNSDEEKELDLLNNSPIINRENEDFIEIGSKNWKYRFYREAMNIYDEDDLESCCLNYIEGLKWTVDYYFKGCKCWKYKYNYRHCPTLSDIINVLNKNNISKIKFNESKPYHYVVQLLSIFPSASKNLIPKEYRCLMDFESNVNDYYPSEFSIDTYYKRYFWQCEPILPLIDYERLSSEARKIKPLKTISKQIFIK